MRFLKKVKYFLHQITSDYEIEAMTFERKKALEKLDGLQLIIARHIFLLSQYPEHTASKGWLIELRSWNSTLRAAHRGKKGQRNFSQKILWKALWEEPLGEKGDRIEMAALIANEKGLPLIDNPHLGSIKKMTQKFVDAILDPTPGFTLNLP